MKKKKDQKFKAMQAKLEISFALFSIIVAAILTLSLYFVAKNLMRQDARENLLKIVSIGAFQIDADAHAKLNESTQKNDETYTQISQTLGQLQTVTENFHCVYTCRLNDKKELVYLVQVEADGKKISHLEETATAAAEKKLLALLLKIHGPKVDDKFVTKDSGTYLTGYAPFYRTDGQLEGVLVIDSEMSGVLANERYFLETAILMFVISTPFIVIFTKLVGRSISVPLSSLEKKSEQQKAFTAIFNAAPIGMLMFDESVAITHINTVAARLVHKNPSDFIGAHPGEGLNCVHSHDNPEGCGKSPACVKCPIRIAHDEVLKTERPVSRVEGQMTLLIDQNEVPLWLQISIEPIELNESKYYVMAIIDITGRKLSQNQIQQQAQIFKQIRGSVTTADLEGNIASWNKGSEDIFGYSAEEAIGKHVSFVYPGGHDGFLRLKKKLFKKGTHEMEAEMVKKSGKKFFAQISLSLLKDPEGEVTHIVNYTTDITSRKKTEKQLQDTLDDSRRFNDRLLEATGRANDMAADAAQASIAKSEFLANMSHEIRTPMNGVISMVDLALDKDLDEDVYDYLTVCKSSADALLAIINDILDFSKIEAGKIDIEIVKSSTQRILIDIDAMMHSRASEKAVGFEIVFDTEVPQFINTDITRVRQCLLNLVGNGLKFTDHGTLTIHVSSQTINDKPAIRFDVEDTGIGISPEQQDLIFDKFSQADSSTTRKFGGTGLGLAITKQLIELLGGTISIESTPGNGSIFSMTIPSNIEPGSQPMISKLDRSNVERQEKPEILNVNLSGNILIAEDDFINQKSIKAILAKTNLNLTIVDDGLQAVEQANTGKYELILMDMQMPKMGGSEATALLREQGCEIPIIALTANVMKQDIQRCLKAGCNTHLSKPIDRVKLFETLAKYLSSCDKTDQANDSSEDNEADRQNQPADCKIAQTTTVSTTNVLETQTDTQSDSQNDDDYENVINWPDMIARFEDEGIIKEIVDAFFIDNPARIEAIAIAIDQANAEDLKPLSHALKGSSATISAQLLADAATQLDEAAKDNDIEKAKEIFVQIRKEFDRLQDLTSKPNWISLVNKSVVAVS